MDRQSRAGNMRGWLSSGHARWSTKCPIAREGTGLGLAIVSKIARQHGATGAIADGDGGKGARMIVHFPPPDIARRRMQVAAVA